MHFVCSIATRLCSFFWKIAKQRHCKERRKLNGNLPKKSSQSFKPTTKQQENTKGCFVLAFGYGVNKNDFFLMITSYVALASFFDIYNMLFNEKKMCVPCHTIRKKQFRNLLKFICPIFCQSQYLPCLTKKSYKKMKKNELLRNTDIFIYIK